MKNRIRLPRDATAKVPPSHVPDGFFIVTRGRPGKRVRRLNAEVDIPVPRTNRVVKLLATRQPGADEQSMAFAMIAYASQPQLQHGQAVHRITTGKTKKPEMQAIIATIQPELFDRSAPVATAVSSFDGSCLIGCATITDLALAAGMTDSAADLRRVRDAILNLYGITETEFDGEDVVRQPQHLIGFDRIEVEGKRGTRRRPITFGINPRLTDTVLGDGTGHTGNYVRIHLAERNQLSRQAAKLLHASLCRDVWPNRPLEAKELESLFSRIYGSDQAQDVTPEAMHAAKLKKDRDRIAEMRRTMRDTVCAALEEIGGLPGWVVTLTRVNRGRYLVRVARTKDQSPAAGPDLADATPQVEE